jgi:hypothetical protein
MEAFQILREPPRAVPILRALACQCGSLRLGRGYWGWSGRGMFPNSSIALKTVLELMSVVLQASGYVRRQTAMGRDPTLHHS